jgi:uncharacterized membrane protein YczE
VAALTPPPFAARVVRCTAGLVLFGLGISLMVRAGLGVPPWDVFHQGVSELTGLPMGTVIILTGVAILLAWIPLHQRVGVGTVLNAVVIGLTVDVALPLLPEAPGVLVGAAFLAGGLAAVAIGSGLYIGAGLGAGPRDGLMLGLAQRGLSLRTARTGLEVGVLLVGWALGGTVGIGTLVFAVAIGPMVHVAVPHLQVRPPELAPAS